MLSDCSDFILYDCHYKTVVLFPFGDVTYPIKKLNNFIEDKPFMILPLRSYLLNYGS